MPAVLAMMASASERLPMAAHRLAVLVAPLGVAPARPATKSTHAVTFGAIDLKDPQCCY